MELALSEIKGRNRQGAPTMIYFAGCFRLVRPKKRTIIRDQRQGRGNEITYGHGPGNYYYSNVGGNGEMKMFRAWGSYLALPCPALPCLTSWLVVTPCSSELAGAKSQIREGKLQITTSYVRSSK